MWVSEENVTVLVVTIQKFLCNFLDFGKNSKIILYFN